MNILVVDDDVGMREVIKDEILINSNKTVTVFVAEDGVRALTILNNESIDLVVSDIKMPKMTGIELLAKIKERWPNLPVILASGYSPISKDEAIRQGAVSLLRKPDDLAQLQSLIKAVA